ncbi:hypothetical protein G2W53_022434 [Senna tora]|uniref:Uncharacterized protein n=1 Tax=Senna tora TaxID=362788 RepID=A0A834TPQ0_9FABA|nr:hypothetical protein G2W53_022434 [Senna tora]
MLLTKPLHHRSNPPQLAPRNPQKQMMLYLKLQSPKKPIHQTQHSISKLPLLCVEENRGDGENRHVLKVGVVIEAVAREVMGVVSPFPPSDAYPPPTTSFFSDNENSNGE